MEMKIKAGYCIFDCVTAQWLCGYPKDNWGGTLENGNIFVFETLKEAIEAADSLTAVVRKRRRDAEIDWNIVSIESFVGIYQRAGRRVYCRIRK